MARNCTFPPGAPSKNEGFGPPEYINNFLLFDKIRIVFSFPLALTGGKLSVFVARRTNRFSLE